MFNSLHSVLHNSYFFSIAVPMIQNLETTLRAGAVPQVPQFSPASVVQPTVNVSKSNSSSVQSIKREAGDKSERFERQPNKSEEQSSSKKPVGAQSESVGKGIVDPLGTARSKVQEEITAEFAAIMATGTLRASEAAALATRRVMERYGNLNSARSQG